MKTNKLNENIYKTKNFIVDDIEFFENYKISIDKTPKNNKIFTSYNRSSFDIENLPFYKKNIEKYLQECYSDKIYTKETWINVVTTDTNKNDNFHFDNCDITFLTYLNEDFNGGEFVYNYRNEIGFIAPKKGLTLILKNNILHKIKPVNKGIRYSLVTFIKFNHKFNKTLI